MIQAISKYITNKIFLYECQSEDYQIHQYGVEVIVSTTINILLLIVIGCITHHLIDSLLYFIFFYIIRKFCGGFHFNHYYSCISTHVMLFVIFIYMPKLFYSYDFMILCFATITFIVLSPYNIRKITHKEIKTYKYISLFVLSLYAMLYYVFNMNIMLYIIFIVSILLILAYLVSD